MLLITLLTTSCGPQKPTEPTDELSSFLAGQPDWYKCLIQDLAELYNHSFENPDPGSITSSDPRELFVTDSNGFDLRIDYRKQRELMRKHPDSLLLRVWVLGHSCSLRKPDSVKAELDINPHGMFAEHLAQLSATDTILRDVHDYIQVMGTARISFEHAFDSNVFNLKKLSHRYTVMVLLTVLNDNLKRQPWDFNGPKYYDPREPFDTSNGRWILEEEVQLEG